MVVGAGEAAGTPTSSYCVGDCNGDGHVTVDELLKGVRISLDTLSVSECRPFDNDSSGGVTVDELVAGVHNALVGCSPLGGIVVNTLADVADPPFNRDGPCGIGTQSELPGADGYVSLREAIIAADNTPGPHTITFARGLKRGTIAITFDDLDPDPNSDALPALCAGNTTINGDVDSDGAPDITLDGAALDASFPGIFVFSSNNVVNGLVLESFLGGGIGVIHVGRLAPAPTVNNVISNNVLTNNGLFNTSTGYTIPALWVIAGCLPGVAVCDPVHDAGVIDGTRIVGNTISNSVGDGIDVLTADAAGSTVADTEVRNNRVTDSGRMGILVSTNATAAGSSTIVSAITISDNTVTGSQWTGIAASGYAGSRNQIADLVIEHNEVHDNANSPIVLGSEIALAAGFCGAKENTMSAAILRNVIGRTDRSTTSSGIVANGANNQTCDAIAPAQDNALTVTISANTFANLGYGIVLLGGQTGANGNTVDAPAVTDNVLSNSGASAIAIYGGVGTMAGQTANADRNSVTAVLSGNQVNDSAGVGIAVLGGNSGPANDNRVEVTMTQNTACGHMYADIWCMGGFSGTPAFPPNTGTGNQVIGSITANTASSIVTANGLPGNTCTLEQSANVPCAR